MSDLCSANSTLAVPFPEAGHDSYDQGNFEQFSGYGGNDDYYDFPKKPSPDQGSFQNLQNTLWLVPILRYLITVNGDSVQMEANPVISLLPVVLQTAASWWFHEQQVLDLLSFQNETIKGDPFPFTTEVVDGEDDKDSKGSSGETAANSERVTSETCKKIRQRKRKYQERTPDDSDEEEYQPPQKQQQLEKNGTDEDQLAKLLWEAINNQNALKVEELLEAGADPNIPWLLDFPLILAIELENSSICKLLLDYGAKKELVCNISNCHSAMSKLLFDSQLAESTERRASILRLLLDRNADITATVDGFFRTAFHAILSKTWDNYPDIRRLALEKWNSSPQVVHNQTSTPFSHLLFNLAENPKHFSAETLAWLIDQGADCHLLNSEKNTPLTHILNIVSKNLIQAADYAGMVEALLIHGCGDHINIFLALLENTWDDYPWLRKLALNSFKKLGIQLHDMSFNGESLLVHTAGSENYSLSAVEFLIAELRESYTLSEDILTEALTACLERSTKTTLARCRTCSEKLKQASAYKIMILLIEGANILVECPRQGYMTLAYIFQDTWDEYPELREFAYQQVTETDKSFEKIIVLGLPLILHVSIFINEYSNETFTWILERCQNPSNFDKEQLSRCLLKALNHRSKPERYSIKSTVLTLLAIRLTIFDRQDKKRKEHVQRIVFRAAFLIRNGASCLYTNHGQENPALVLLVDRRWDDYSELRRLAIQSIAEDEADVNAIKINRLSILQTTIEQDRQELSNSIATPSGIHFLMTAGVIPLPVDIGSYARQKEYLKWQYSYCKPDLTAAKEINAVCKELVAQCGLKYEVIQVILQQPDLEDDDILQIYSESFKTYSHKNYASPSTYTSLVISDVKVQIISYLKAIVQQRCAAKP